MLNNQKPATKGKSPYMRYGKSPYRYSDELNNWTAAIKRGDKAAADRYDRAWKSKFGVKAPTPNYDELDFRAQQDDWNHSYDYR